jgi:hypothetical protein
MFPPTSRLRASVCLRPGGMPGITIALKVNIKLEQGAHSMLMKLTVLRLPEQRQIIRILWMPMVFAIISFFSYRYYRTYVYYKLIVLVYEAFVLMAFLALMLAYIGSSTSEQMAVMQDKDKRPLPWPFGVSQLHMEDTLKTSCVLMMWASFDSACASGQSDQTSL